MHIHCPCLLLNDNPLREKLTKENKSYRLESSIEEVGDMGSAVSVVFSFLEVDGESSAEPPHQLRAKETTADVNFVATVAASATAEEKDDVS